MKFNAKSILLDSNIAVRETSAKVTFCATIGILVEIVLMIEFNLRKLV